MQKHLWFGLVMWIGAFYAGVDANADNAVSAAGSGQQDTATITMATGGTSDYVIVVPDGDDPHDRVKKASGLLPATLAEATGIKLPVVMEG